MAHRHHLYRSFFQRLGALLLVPGVVFYLSSASAEQRELKTDASEKVDAVLVVDGSGSMLVTDPGKLRDEGAKLFAQFLKSGDRLGIVGFSETSRVIRELSDYDSSQSDQIGKALSDVGTTGQFTNLLEGVKAAKELLERSPREGASRSIVLLSDGKMDPSPSQGSADALTSDLADNYLATLKAEGIKIYTLYFSDEADKDLLKEIAAATEGINWFTPNADKIHESFADLFLAIKKPQVVPLTRKGFKIDQDVQEATFYINREGATQEVQLISPKGEKFTQASSSSSLKWFSGQKFDVITLTAPIPGDWQLEGISNNDGFATVLTNLKLVSDWPTNVSAGEKALLQARLYESEKPIELREMTDAVKYAFQITPTDRISEPIIREFLVDDGTHGDKIAHDGIYSLEVKIEDAGEYKLRILAKAPTFERNQQIPFRVKPELITLKVASVEEEAAHGAEEHAKVKDYFRIELDTEALSFKRVEVKLAAVDEHRGRYELPITQSKENKLRYEAPASILPKDGEYKLTATLSAEGKKKDIKVASRPTTYTKMKPEESEHEPETKVVLAAPEPPKVESPLLYILLVTLINAGLGGAVFMLLKKLSVNVEDSVPVFEPVDPIRAFIAELQGKLAFAEVDLASPMFTDPNFQLKPTWTQHGSSGGVVASPVSGAEVSEENGEERVEDSTSSSEDGASSEDASAEEAEEGEAPSEES